MEQHVRILGILHIALGALGLVGALVLLAIFGGIAGIITQTPGTDTAAYNAIPILGIIFGGIALLVAVISLPGIIAGIGLLRFRPWGRVLGIVISALDLLNVPFGTALGVYGLWVLLQARTELLFRNPPPQPAAAYR